MRVWKILSQRWRELSITAKFGSAFGLLLALTFALCPYVIGVGGAGGLQWASHIVAIAFVVFALVFVSRPVVAGLMLGLASGTPLLGGLIYPFYRVPEGEATRVSTDA